MLTDCGRYTFAERERDIKEELYDQEKERSGGAEN